LYAKNACHYTHEPVRVVCTEGHVEPLCKRLGDRSCGESPPFGGRTTAHLHSRSIARPVNKVPSYLSRPCATIHPPPAYSHVHGGDHIIRPSFAICGPDLSESWELAERRHGKLSPGTPSTTVHMADQDPTTLLAESSTWLRIGPIIRARPSHAYQSGTIWSQANVNATVRALCRGSWDAPPTRGAIQGLKGRHASISLPCGMAPFYHKPLLVTMPGTKL